MTVDAATGPQPSGAGGIPFWVFLLEGLVVLGSAVPLGYILLLAAAFGCDSGWSGCSDLGLAALGVYAGSSLILVVGTVAWAGLTSRTRSGGHGVRIVLLFLIPVLPPLALVLAFMFYFAGASVFA